MKKWQILFNVKPNNFVANIEETLRIKCCCKCWKEIKVKLFESFLFNTKRKQLLCKFLRKKNKNKDVEACLM